MSTILETRYARSGEAYIAYQVMGEGPIDLIFVPGFISHLDIQMEQPAYANFMARFSSFCRLIRFDKRGTGLSDRVSSIPTLEERMDDVRAVMDAADSTRAVLLGYSEGGPMSIVFSATYPERTAGLILYASFARRAWAPDNVWGVTEEQLSARLQSRDETWGHGSSIDTFMPSQAGDSELRKLYARLERASVSPGAAKALDLMNYGIDVRHVLPTINIPTLVMHRKDDVAVNVENSRYLGKNIKGAKYVEFEGIDHSPWVGDANAILAEIKAFLTGSPAGIEPDFDRVLASILFTDIVGSTAHLVELGDRAWTHILDQHNSLVREQLSRFRGREIGTTGDGFLAAFDGPARAIRCAQAIGASVTSLGIKVRAGVHTGECEIVGEKLGGIAVHVGARIGALAAAGEVLVSSTVRDLVVGSGIKFESRGIHSLKGVPGDWNLLAAM